MAAKRVASVMVAVFLLSLFLSPTLPTEAARPTREANVTEPIIFCPACVCCAPAPKGSCCSCCTSSIQAENNQP